MNEQSIPHNYSYGYETGRYSLASYGNIPFTGQEIERFYSLLLTPQGLTASAIRDRIEGKRTIQKIRAAFNSPVQKVSLLIDIQSSIKA